MIAAALYARMCSGPDLAVDTSGACLIAAMSSHGMCEASSPAPRTSASVRSSILRRHGRCTSRYVSPKAQTAGITTTSGAEKDLLFIVGILTGGGAALSSASANGGAEWDSSLVGLLVLIAAIGLLFTGRYLPGLFDLIVGLNRWVYRVGSYVLLLRDEYPAFHLDQGPEKPVGHASTEPGV